ncbi:MAG: hypothetical protein ACR2LJ_00855 [Acidimicrobiales bacterium]
MNIVKKIGAAGTAIVASAATLMLGIGPASASRPISLNEVDGMQLFQGGIAAQMVVDVNCTPGHRIVLGVASPRRCVTPQELSPQARSVSSPVPSATTMSE